jgi:hypothetical protein
MQLRWSFRSLYVPCYSVTPIPWRPGLPARKSPLRGGPQRLLQANRGRNAQISGFNGETTFNELSSILYVFTENENTLVVSGLIDYLNDFSTEKQRN